MLALLTAPRDVANTWENRLAVSYDLLAEELMAMTAERDTARAELEAEKREVERLRGVYNSMYSERREALIQRDRARRELLIAQEQIAKLTTVVEGRSSATGVDDRPFYAAVWGDVAEVNRLADLGYRVAHMTTVFDGKRAIDTWLMICQIR